MPIMPPIDLGKIVVKKATEVMNPQELGGALQAVGQVIQKSNLPVTVPASIMKLFQGEAQGIINRANPQPQVQPSTAPIPQNVPMQPQQNVSQQTELNQPPDKQPNMFWEFLKRAGVPMGAALVGGIAPSTLPEMSGLATGWEGQKQLEDANVERLKREYLKSALENSGSKEFIVIDPETGEQKSYTVPKAATVQQKRQDNSWLPPEMQQMISGKMGGGDPEVQSMINELKKTKNSTEIKELLNQSYGRTKEEKFNPELYSF